MDPPEHDTGPAGGETPTPEAVPGDVSTSDLWENVGFHRPLAGFFYNLPFYLVVMIFGIIAYSWLFGIMYPFPESIGYRTAATAIFGLFFQAFDLGTAHIMNRFIGEANIKDPAKMVKYIQYFIWYQMITGLIQTTSVSLYALYVVPSSQLGYAVWIMLIHATTQFPGFLGVFRNVLNTLQQYHRVAVLNFISGEVFQRITEIAFVLIGRQVGAANPAIGEIMGIAIGSVIGLYVDDFIATAFSAYFFQKVMRNYGFTVRTCFRHDLDKGLVKECLSWGIKSGLPGMVWGAQVFISILLWITYVPQYTTFAALAAFTGAIGGLMSTTLDLGGSISEAFFNGKPALAQYIIGQAWRYTAFIQFLFVSILMLVIMIIQPVLILIGLEYYILGAVFILPRMIRDTQQPYNNFSEESLTGTGHINFQMIMKFFEAGIALVSWYVVIVWLQLPQRYGLVAVAWAMPCTELPAILAKIAINYVFIHKRVMKVKIPWFQTLVAPAVSTTVILFSGLAYVTFVFVPLAEGFGTLVALVPTIIIFIIVVPFLVYFPLTGALGAWDDGSMDVLHKATKMSGAGKFFSIPMYKILSFITARSRLHGKFSFDDTEALKEARELMVIKNAKREKQVTIA